MIYRLNFLFLIILVFIYGIAIGKYQIFPYQQIKNIVDVFDDANITLPQRNNEVQIQMFEYFDLNADIVFIGDSITKSGKWNEFFPMYRSANRGVWGDQTKDILARMDSIYSTNSEKAFIMIGINDIQQLVPHKTIISNYEKIIDLLLYKKIQVYVQSTVQCQIKKCGFRNVEAVNLLNKDLELLANEKNVTFIDLGELSDKNGLDDLFTHDGVHLNVNGYLYWVNKLSFYVNF